MTSSLAGFPGWYVPYYSAFWSDEKPQNVTILAYQMKSQDSRSAKMPQSGGTKNPSDCGLYSSIADNRIDYYPFFVLYNDIQLKFPGVFSFQ